MPTFERQAFEVDLPSRGLPYPDHPTLSTGKVTIHPIRAAEEKILAGMTGAQGRVLDSMNLLLERCLAEDIKPDDLTTTDWYFLMVRVRIVSYGEEYPFSVRCRNCRETFEHTVNLTELEMRTLPDDFSEPFELELPMSKETVGLRLLRGSDEKTIFKAHRLGKSKSPLESASYLKRIESMVVTVDGVEFDGKNSIRDKKQWVENLVGLDSGALQSHVSKMDSGYSGKIPVECSACAYDFSIMLPWESNFFPWGGEG